MFPIVLPTPLEYFQRLLNTSTLLCHVCHVATIGIGKASLQYPSTIDRQLSYNAYGTVDPPIFSSCVRAANELRGRETLGQSQPVLSRNRRFVRSQVLYSVPSSLVQVNELLRC